MNTSEYSYLDADPTNYCTIWWEYKYTWKFVKSLSFLELEERKWKYNKVYIDIQTWIHMVMLLSSEKWKYQMLVSLILKWLISVADIIKLNKEITGFEKDIFLSKVFDPWLIQVELSNEEIRSDCLLMELLFLDWDHWFNHNMRIDWRKYYFYDFNPQLFFYTEEKFKKLIWDNWKFNKFRMIDLSRLKSTSKKITDFYLEDPFFWKKHFLNIAKHCWLYSEWEKLWSLFRTSLLTLKDRIQYIENELSQLSLTLYQTN